MATILAVKNYIRVIRPQQWYKNALIFLPIIFAERIFETDLFFATFIGFFALCLISSSGYILNDIVDRRNDLLHPVKKNRPIASGKIKPLHALFFSFFLLSAGLIVCFFLSFAFLLFVTSLFISTQIYSFFLKKEPFADILAISVNFVIRSVSGAFILSSSFMPYISISSWLVLCPFFLALFLSSSKRRSEILQLEDDASKHRTVLEFYNHNITAFLLTLSTTSLIMVYSLYIFFSQYPMLIFSLPLMLYLVFRFVYFVESKSKIAQHPELLYKDKRFIFVTALVFLIVVSSIYFN